MTDQSPTPIRDALDKLNDLPINEATIGAVAKQGGDAGVIAEAQNDIGKPGGWGVYAAAQWMKKAGWSVVAALKWKK